MKKRSFLTSLASIFGIGVSTKSFSNQPSDVAIDSVKGNDDVTYLSSLFQRFESVAIPVKECYSFEELNQMLDGAGEAFDKILNDPRSSSDLQVFSVKLSLQEGPYWGDKDKAKVFVNLLALKRPELDGGSSLRGFADKSMDECASRNLLITKELKKHAL